MKKVLIFIIILIIIYLSMFHMTNDKLKYITMGFYTMSMISSISNLFVKFS